MCKERKVYKDSNWSPPHQPQTAAPHNLSHVATTSWVNSGGEGNNTERDADDSESTTTKNTFTVIANFQPRRVRDDEKMPIPSKNKPLCLRGNSNKKSKAEFLLSSMIMIFQLIFLPCIAIKKIVSHGKTMAYYT